MANATVANSLVALIRSNPGKQVIATLVAIVLKGKEKAKEKEKKEKGGEENER